MVSVSVVANKRANIIKKNANSNNSPWFFVVGDRAGSGAGDHHAGADDRLAGQVDDRSRDFLLGECSRASEEEQERCQHNSEMMLHHVGIFG